MYLFVWYGLVSTSIAFGVRGVQVHHRMIAECFSVLKCCEVIVKLLAMHAGCILDEACQLPSVLGPHGQFLKSQLYFYEIPFFQMAYCDT